MTSKRYYFPQLDYEFMGAVQVPELILSSTRISNVSGADLPLQELQLHTGIHAAESNSHSK
jgi:hypothetical protein